ncbi:MAG: hypothetical protein ABI183_09660 [Polyangiaceae bacterium]
MAREKYRLDPLARARQAHVERASRSLGEASRAKVAAEQLRKRIEEDALRAESEAKRIRADEHAEVAQVRAADLATYDQWEIRAQSERADREQRLQVAKAGESKEALRERAARAEVERRQAAAQVVERDRERWKQREAQRVEARQETEASEVWRKPSK